MSISRDYEIAALDAKARTAFERWLGAPEDSETQSQAYAEYEKYSNHARALINAPAKQSTTSGTGWSDGVIARYLTIGGATVDLTEESDYIDVTVPTQTVAKCIGCGGRHVEEWGWSFWAKERGEEQPDTYQQRGEHATPQARRWAQAHAETCRAIPRPAN